jgi:hypothetical protein
MPEELHPGSIQRRTAQIGGIDALHLCSYDKISKFQSVLVLGSPLLRVMN